MTTLSFNAGSGDCWGDNDGNFSNSGTFLWLAGTNGIDFDVRTWIPFVVNLPSLLITSAVIRWVASQTRSDAVDVRIACEASDNAASPVDNGGLLGRTLTSSKVFTSLEAYTTGNQYSYDITGPVQEVLNRSGWVYGNTLAVIVDDDGTINDRRRQIASYENGTYARAILDITYNAYIPQSGMI